MEPTELGYEKPNHTQTPNSFFDVSLREIKSLAEIKVVLAIVRQTFGWQKKADRISLSQLEAMTGLTRESVSLGIQSALAHDLINRKAHGNGFIYNLKVVGQTDQSEKPTRRKSRLETVGQSDQKLVGNSDTQKKRKEKKETSPAYAELIAHHAGFLDGPIPDPGAQGKAVNGLLENYTPQECKDYYAHLRGEKWRTSPVTWLTVKRGIADWLARGRNGNSQNGHKPKVETDPFGEPWIPKPFTAEDAIFYSPDKNPDDVRANFEGRLAWEDVRCR